MTARCHYNQGPCHLQENSCRGMMEKTICYTRGGGFVCCWRSISTGLFGLDGELRFLASLDTDYRKTADQICVDLMNLFQLYHFRYEDVTDSILCSVVPPLNFMMEKALTRLLGKPLCRRWNSSPRPSLPSTWVPPLPSVSFPRDGPMRAAFCCRGSTSLWRPSPGGRPSSRPFPFRPRKT